MMGYSFRRQRPIGNFIADFVCLPLNLIVEVDGFSHEEDGVIDDNRDNELKELGFTTLRFSSWEVLNQIDEVANTIGEWIKENAIVPLRSRNKLIC